MKLLLFLFTALSLLNPIFTHAITSNPNLGLSLSPRAIPENAKPEPESVPKPEPAPKQEPEPVPKEEPLPEEPEAGAGSAGKITYHNIKKRIQSLPKKRWVTYTISKGAAAGRWLASRPMFNRQPKPLYEIGRDGIIISHQTTGLDKKTRGQLREVPGRTGLYVLNRKDPIIQRNLLTGQIRLNYKTEYYSPKGSLDGIFQAQQGYDSVDAHWQIVPGVNKRSDPIQALDGQGGGSTNKNSPQDPSDIFRQYLEVLQIVKTGIGAAIAPVLNNITSQTKSVFIHQMALSIYYDLTGSTTSLVGPFNYGISFLGNISNMTTTSSTGQGGENAPTNGNASDIAEYYMAVESVYAAMWVDALTAANSTGLLAEQAYLVGCVNTNDTSVYPPGFTTVSKGGNSGTTRN